MSTEIFSMVNGQTTISLCQIVQGQAKFQTTIIKYVQNKNTWDVKKCGPIRSNIVNRQAQPKYLISAEAKKLLYQNICNSLNDTQYYSIFSQV